MMVQDRFEMKKENGRYLTYDELYDLAKEQLIDELENMSTSDAIYLGNEIRDNNRYERLYENNEENINEVLDGWSPWDIINVDYDGYSDFFTFDGYDIDFTDDVWYDLETDEVAEAILDGGYSRYINSDIRDLLDDYEEAKDWIENFNPIREAGAVILAKYVNCEADVTDLLQFIDNLVRNEDAWEEM